MMLEHMFNGLTRGNVDIPIMMGIMMASRALHFAESSDDDDVSLGKKNRSLLRDVFSLQSVYRDSPVHMYRTLVDAQSIMHLVRLCFVKLRHLSALFWCRTSNRQLGGGRFIAMFQHELLDSYLADSGQT